MITIENAIKHELIGLDVEIIKSSNAQNIGKKGRIVDETKSIFVLNSGFGFKKIPKKNSWWRFQLKNSVVDLDGNMLSKRSFERLGLKP